MKRAIILFTRVPLIGKSKTRLESLLSKEKIQNVSKYLLNKTYQTIQQVEADIFCFITPSIDPKDFQHYLPDLKDPVFEQTGVDIGQKMFNAIESVKNMGYQQVVLIGSDIYDLTSELLTQSFEFLEDHQIVIAPTRDGGYGLIGMNQAHYQVFDLPAHSHNEVFEQVMERAKAAHLSVKTLQTIQDIDTPEDVIQAITGDPEAKFLAQGEYNANFIFDDNQKLLRVALGSQLGLSHQIQYEYNTLCSLEQTNIVPKALHLEEYAPLLDSGYLIEAFLPGEPLNYARDYLIAANLLAKIHQVDIEEATHLIVADQPFKVMMNEFESMFQVYRQWEDKDVSIVERIDHFLDLLRNKYDLDSQIIEPSIINTELNSHNFLINPVGQKSYIIDWEKALIGEKEQDLAHFLVPTTTLWRTHYCFSEEEIEQFIQAYDLASPDKPVNRDRLNQYLLFTCMRGVTWCAMAYVQYNQSDKIAINLERYQVISRFISHEFLDIIENYYQSRGFVIHNHKHTSRR